MRVLLINPPMPYQIRGHRQTPLGLCYLSSMIKPIAESMVFDCNVSENIEDLVCSFSPDVIGVSVLTATFNSSVEMVSRISPLTRNGCMFIAGGIHASIYPEEVLHNGFSLVIRGEGENTFYNVLSAIASSKCYHGERGISYTNETGVIVNNPNADLITDLDKIPFPDRSDLPFHNYEHESILTSRGCNYRCFYCSSSHYWGQRIRYRSAENVFAELMLLYQNGRTNFYFCDDNFASSRELVRKICRMILTEGIHIKWSALIRVDAIDLSLLRLMKESGCSILSLGIESGLNSFHKTIKKMSVESIKVAFERIKQAGIKTRTTWIVGLGDTYEDEYQSLQLIKELLSEQVSVHCLIPFPNTEAWNNAEQYGIILERDNFNWDVMNMTYSPHLLDHVGFKHITKEQVITLLNVIRNELLPYGYDGLHRKFGTFLDSTIIKVID